MRNFWWKRRIFEKLRPVLDSVENFLQDSHKHNPFWINLDHFIAENPKRLQLSLNGIKSFNCEIFDENGGFSRSWGQFWILWKISYKISINISHFGSILTFLLQKTANGYNCLSMEAKVSIAKFLMKTAVIREAEASFGFCGKFTTR